MEKNRYPADWKQIALEVKEAAGWKCQRCGKQCRRPGEDLSTPGRAGHQFTLTVHHMDHQPENCSAENLIALCAPCHLRADAAWHAETRRKKKMRQAPEAGWVIRERPRWIHTGGTDRSWGFVCEKCQGLVYWPQPTRGDRTLRCSYPKCPWCGAEMGGVYGAESEGQL